MINNVFRSEMVIVLKYNFVQKFTIEDWEMILKVKQTISYLHFHITAFKLGKSNILSFQSDLQEY